MSEESDLGKKGEQLACDHLAEHGFRIVDRNVRFKKAEIDIVAMKFNTMVFVEVKTRSSPYLSTPNFTIPMKKQRQMVKVADFYLKDNDIDFESRFDVITVIIQDETGDKSHISHLEGAFLPSV